MAWQTRQLRHTQEVQRGEAITNPTPGLSEEQINEAILTIGVSALIPLVPSIASGHRVPMIQPIRPSPNPRAKHGFPGKL